MPSCEFVRSSRVNNSSADKKNTADRFPLSGHKVAPTDAPSFRLTSSIGMMATARDHHTHYYQALPFEKRRQVI